MLNNLANETRLRSEKFLWLEMLIILVESFDVWIGNGEIGIESSKIWSLCCVGVFEIEEIANIQTLTPLIGSEETRAKLPPTDSRNATR